MGTWPVPVFTSVELCGSRLKDRPHVRRIATEHSARTANVPIMNVAQAFRRSRLTLARSRFLASIGPALGLNGSGRTNVAYDVRLVEWLAQSLRDQHRPGWTRFLIYLLRLVVRLKRLADIRHQS